MQHRRSYFLVLIMLVLFSVILTGCSENHEKETDTPVTADEMPANLTDPTELTPETEETVKDNLGEYNFGDASFGMMTFENQNFHYEMRTDEVTGEQLNDAMFDATLSVEDRFHIAIEELYYADFSTTPRVNVTAGDTSMDVVRIRCTDATGWWTDGLLVTADDMPVIDLSKPYWDKTINDSLTVANQHYVALSSFDLCTYDLTFALMFNKSYISNYGFEIPYDLVLNGQWTMDKMNEMMITVSKDTDGNGVRDKNDQWGYVAHPKMVSPGFWIGADALSIEKDENDIPHLNIGSEKFINVWEKLISICYSDNQYLGIDDSADIPTDAILIFSENRALFMDMSFFFTEELRSMESDFGIIPYDADHSMSGESPPAHPAAERAGAATNHNPFDRRHPYRSLPFLPRRHPGTVPGHRPNG